LYQSIRDWWYNCLLPSVILEKEKVSMKPIVKAVSLMILMFVAAAAEAQSSSPKPAPELKQWDVWVGNWTISGIAKDSPTGAEYKVDWHTHGRWILGGFFAELEHTWKGNGQEFHHMEILSYDSAKKIHAVSGFSSDGTTWTLTATFDNGTSDENMLVKGPDGELVTCHNAWVFSSDRMAVSGTQECEQNGVRWTSFKVKGMKSKTAH
jgi:hypothetical protein